VTVAIDTLLERTDTHCGGRIRIRGTRITVNQIVVMYTSGLSPEEITNQLPHLDLAQVYSALAYYHANREEVESSLEAELEEAEALENELSPSRSGAA
jgi:uncharacterized protein (DUF433 family)